MNILPKYKIGNCSCGCGGKDVEGRKVGKTFYCAASYDTMKQKQQVAKANLRNSVRGLNGRQKEMGLSDSASRAALIQDLDAVFSRWIRLRDANEHGFASCITCGKIKHFSLNHCGHYISRSNLGLRWDTKNCNSQCYDCNCNKHGNLEVYAKKLDETESGLSDRLKEIAKDVTKPTISEIKQTLIDYRIKLRIMEKSKPNATK